MTAFPALSSYHDIYLHYIHTMKRLMITLAAVLALAACSREENSSFTWATLNVRYDNPEDGSNNWQYRRERVCRFIQERQIDVIGMQEVLHGQFRDLRQGLPGYEGIGVGREDGQTKGEYAPLFYRTDRLEVLNSGTFWLSEHPDHPGLPGWDGACQRIATWAKFREKATGKIFMGVNTHFDHVGQEARRQSALLIISKIQDIVGSHPAIVTGDFNVTDTSEAYRTITTDSFPLLDAHRQAARTLGVGYTYHDFARIPPAECEKIDFVFVTPSIHVLSSEIPAEAPDSLLSDHNPQVVRLQF